MRFKMRVIPKKTSRITEVIKSQIAENLKAYIIVSIILLMMVGMFTQAKKIFKVRN